MQTRYSPDATIHTTLVKIIERAGLVPWQKPMQNMRVTRETELLAHYPAKDMTSWLGCSPEIASKHYAMTMQASSDRENIGKVAVCPAMSLDDFVSSCPTRT